jgi:glycolate oxidase
MAQTAETLKPEVYQALEDIVGPKYLSQEPANLETYCFACFTDLVVPGKFGIRPLAVILPGSTKEVQAVVKACNRYRVVFKAHSTGFGPGGTIGAKPFLNIDLRRMNRILDINVKNKYAVVEPYVSMAALMNEAIKKGLRCHIIGAGPSCSILANATSTWGYGTVNVSAGHGGRNVLAAEWVLPDGELLRLGSLGNSGEWFSPDGPGFSLRGLMRGACGQLGSLGVFTKAAVKLTPWYGPPKIKTWGKPPSYVTEVPDGIKSFVFTFPSMEAMYEALRLIQEEKIAYWCSRRGPFTQAAAASPSNKELLEAYQTEEFQKTYRKFNYNLSVGLDASSTREMEFKIRCLQKIIEKTGGEEFEDTINGITAKFIHAYNGTGATKGTFRSTGGMNSNPSCQESWDAVRLAQEKGVELKEKYSKAGVFLDDGDPTWVTILEDFGGHMEVPLRYDPIDRENMKKVLEHNSEATNLILDLNLGIGEFEAGMIQGWKVHEEAGPRMHNYHDYMTKVKKAFDPNRVGEVSACASASFLTEV